MDFYIFERKEKKRRVLLQLGNRKTEELFKKSEDDATSYGRWIFMLECCKFFKRVIDSSCFGEF